MLSPYSRLPSSAACAALPRNPVAASIPGHRFNDSRVSRDAGAVCVRRSEPAAAPNLTEAPRIRTRGRVRPVQQVLCGSAMLRMRFA